MSGWLSEDGLDGMLNRRRLFGSFALKQSVDGGDRGRVRAAANAFPHEEGTDVSCREVGMSSLQPIKNSQRILPERKREIERKL